MINKDIVLSKLLKIKNYIQELKTFSNITFEEYKRDFIKKRAVERLILLLAEVATDINSYVIVEIGKNPPTDYYDSFIKAIEIGLISKQLGEKLAPSAGLRNRLVHEYDEIKDDIVYSSIKEAIKLYTDFVKEVNYYIRQ
ncbi:MAG: DUF86 domain-containing protein [Candidatus Humimicrobiia bacterium]